MTEIESDRVRPQTEARRLELVRIAFRLIAEKGLEGLRTRDVAAAAGIDTGTLHYHYASKEVLIQAVVDYLLGEFRNHRVPPGPGQVSVMDRVRSEVRDVAIRVKESPEQFVVMFELRARSFRDPAIAAMLGRVAEGWGGMVTRLMDRGVKEGEFRADLDVGQAALIFRSEMSALAFAGLSAPDQVDELASAMCAHLEMWLSAPR